MLQKKRILAIIPARGGSKGVPRKNLRQVMGKSLIARTIEIAKLSKFIDRVVVSSEDLEIISEAKRYGADVPFVRPQELAQDHTPGIEPILHALQEIPDYDYVIVLQVTSPLRSVEDIDHCLQFCLDQNAKVCVSVNENKKSPLWMFSIKHDNKLQALLSGEIITQRQNLPVTYTLNGAMFVAHIPWLEKNKSFFSDETVGYIMPEERSLDIDTESDLFLLEFYLQHHPNYEKSVTDLEMVKIQS